MPGAPTVLIVEDNLTMRALIRSLVEGVSGTVHECADGETAVELYDRLHPDWVLMDVKMGGMDGIAATHLIRKSHPDARIVIVTEQRGDEYARAASDAGACGFVGKENLMALPGLIGGSTDRRIGGSTDRRIEGDVT